METSKYEISRKLIGHTSSVNAVRWTGDGKFCFTASDDKTVRLWNPHRTNPILSTETTYTTFPSGLCIMSYGKDVHSYPILDIGIFHDKTRFITIGRDKNFFIWDVSTGKVIMRMSMELTIPLSTHAYQSIAIGGNDAIVAIGSTDCMVNIWDLRSKSYQPIQTLREANDAVTGLAFHGTSLVSASVDGYIRTYDVRNGQLHTDYIGEAMTGLDLSDDGELAVVPCLNGTIKVQEMSTGRQLCSLRGHKHTSFRLHASLQNDHSHVICGSEDGRLLSWNLQKPSIFSTEIISIPIGVKMPAVIATSFSPTNSSFLSSSQDGSVCYWEEKKS